MYDRGEDKAREALSKRVNLTLPDSVFHALERWADAEGRPTANLAAFLVEMAVKQAEDQNKIPPPPKKKEEK
ncbi:ribbon-helix-helix domain-containing protein [Phormidesmis priestleyi]